MKEEFKLRHYQNEVIEDTEASLEFGSTNLVVESPPACVPGYTEFLTPNGWKRIDEYNNNDLICVVSNRGTTLFEKPIKYINQECEEDFLKIKNNKLNIVVSKNHTIPFLPILEEKCYKNFYIHYETIKAEDIIDIDKDIYIERLDDISIVENKITSNTTHLNISYKNQYEIEYEKPIDNKHYCFETSTGFWLMRQNGNIYPTGNSGKSIIISETARRLANKNKKIVISINISALLDQIAKHLDIVKADYSILKSGRESEFDETKLIQLCQAQTLHARLSKMDKFKSNYFMSDECFTPETEILTENGFIRFDQLDKNIKVAQYNSESDGITYVNPIRYIKNYTTDDLVHMYSDNGIDLITTKNHEMLIFDRKKNQIKKTYAIDLKKSTNNLMLVSSLNTVSRENQDELSYYEKLELAFQADGSYHSMYSGKYKDSNKCSILFSFSKERKLKEFEKTFTTANKLKSHCKTDNKKERKRFILENVLKNKLSKNLRDIFDITKFSTKKAIAFLDYLMIWDGHITKEGAYYYSSKIKDNVEFVQEICIIAGKKTRLGIQIDNRSDTFSDIYRIYISHTNKFTTSRIKTSLVKYNGYVYCVEVPDGNIVVRRNNKVIIVGNCHREYNTKRTREMLEHLEIDARIGYSGTPYDEAGFLLEGCELLRTTTAIDLQNQGFLCPIRYYVPKWAESVDFSNLKKSGNDYSEKDLNEIINTDNHLRLAIESMNKMNAKNKKTMIFCSGIEQAEKFAEMLQKEGYSAFAYHSKQDKKESEKILNAFINNTKYIKKLSDDEQPTLFDDSTSNKSSGSDVTCLLSVNKLGIGFDCPDVKLGVQLRPTKIRSLYIQQVMRMARQYKPLTSLLNKHSLI